MTYCGPVGSVHVLSLLSTDLFDESQENPFLLTAAADSPSASPSRASASPSRASAAFNTELPLDDALHEVGPLVRPSLVKSEAARDAASPLRSILKRQSSYESAASTSASTSASDVPTALYQPQELPQQPARNQYQYQPQSQHGDDTMGPLATDSELHKLLYSLTRFGLASDAPPPPPPPPTSPEKPRGVSFASKSAWPRPQPVPQPQPDKKHRGRSKRGAPTARGSVTYATVKSLLRGGSGGRSDETSPSRTARRSVPDFRRKSMGTVSSRLKRRHKFARPTILTDAYHRVSDMKLGTKPLGPAIKHIAFPDMWEAPEDRAEADPDMPSPRGQLHRRSLVSLETLDKIGTRAACPVHLLVEAAPDFSHVRARVDSYNHVRSPSRGLRRPSDWLPSSAVAGCADDESADGESADGESGDEDAGDQDTGTFADADGGF